MRSITCIIALSLCMFITVANATTICPGPVSGHWYASGNPYNVCGEITVPSDSTLYIHEGVEVVFQGHFKLIVNGYLEAIGTETDSIVFTALNPNSGWHGIRFFNAQDSSHLSYCVIQHGRAYGNQPDCWGGGIYCAGSNPVLTHCAVRLNWAEEYDGGMSIYYYSNPIISHCTIAENSTDGSGGGVVCYQSNPIISYCTISGNSAQEANGGLWCLEASPTISHCNITGNSAGLNSGGIEIQGVSNPTISHCTIDGNSAGSEGGAIRVCYASQPIIERCVIHNNIAGTNGGGILSAYNSCPEITHCNIIDNTAQSGGGIYVQSSSATVVNTIVSDNDGGGIYFGSQNVSVSFCDFHENQGYNFSGNLPQGLGVIDSVNINNDPCDCYCNIFLDPMFVNHIAGDYHLLAESPCIDAGDPTSPLDPDGTIADIGVYYYVQSSWAGERMTNISPNKYRLCQNYPNPFNPATTITFALPVASDVTLQLFNTLGQWVGTLLSGWRPAGTYEITFDGSELATGVYFYQLDAGVFTGMKRMVLLK